MLAGSVSSLCIGASVLPVNPKSLRELFVEAVISVLFVVVKAPRRVSVRAIMGGDQSLRNAQAAVGEA
jgi:hypothetical protein